MMILSANWICFSASFTAPSVMSMSSRFRQFFASTTVMQPSYRIFSVIHWFSLKVFAIGTGSAMPLVSMRTMSSLLPTAIFFWIWEMASTRSPRTWQHMQPLSMRITCSAISNFCCWLIRSLSIAISPNSFSITAIFFSFCSVKM